jgi:hypothetical protein
MCNLHLNVRLHSLPGWGGPSQRNAHLDAVVDQIMAADAA